MRVLHKEDILQVLLVVSSLLTQALSEHFTNTWAVRLAGGSREAERLARKHGFRNLGQIMSSYYHFEHPEVPRKSPNAEKDRHTRLKEEATVEWAEQQVVKIRQKRSVVHASNRRFLNDPEWPHMWYLNRMEGYNLNVVPAWERGYTGKGVTLSVLDDGIEKDHPDLKRNYDAKASYDINGGDSDPTPRWDGIGTNRHGTRCAGEIAAMANNSVCSVGIAFNARIGGVRMLDGDVTDAIEAQAISLNPTHIDIYSAAWGPNDDGRTMDGPGYMTKKAFLAGIEKGRHGRGSIFVWSAGNGGREDDCNCDGYVSSIYTIAINAVSMNGFLPWYAEKCSAILATTYSSGSYGEQNIVTTDLRRGCTEKHTGTSAAAPLAAGICALALEANRNLTWRDMQHIIVRTSRPKPFTGAEWTTNAAGHKVSPVYGFGLMDALAMVKLAERWKRLPPHHTCEIHNVTPKNRRDVNANDILEFRLHTDGCKRTSHRVLYLEHVQVKVNITSARRGKVRIYLTSPYGTRSKLLSYRLQDYSPWVDATAWPFTTVQNWGEMANGTWKLEMQTDYTKARLNNWTLILHGSAEPIIIEENKATTPKSTPSPTTSSGQPSPKTQPSTAGTPKVPALSTTTTKAGTIKTSHPTKSPASTKFSSTLIPTPETPVAPPGCVPCKWRRWEGFIKLTHTYFVEVPLRCSIVFSSMLGNGVLMATFSTPDVKVVFNGTYTRDGYLLMEQIYGRHVYPRTKDKTVLTIQDRWLLDGKFFPLYKHTVFHGRLSTPEPYAIFAMPADGKNTGYISQIPRQHMTSPTSYIWIVFLSVICGVLILLLVGLAVYALDKRKRLNNVLTFLSVQDNDTDVENLLNSTYNSRNQTVVVVRTPNNDARQNATRTARVDAPNGTEENSI